MKAKDLVLVLPAVALALSLDRLSPDRFKPARATVDGLAQAAPMLPGVNEGRLGRPGEPLSLVLVGAPGDVRDALTEAGWTEVPTSLRGSLAAGLGELLDGRPPISFPPPSDYRLVGRRQGMNWAVASGTSPGRLLFRLWRTGLEDRNGRDVWWGAGRDGLDADRERDLVLRTLSGSRFAQTSALLRLPQIPAEGVDDEGRAYRTDGRAAVIALRRPAPAARSAR